MDAAAHPRWAERLVECNLHPARLVHDSWLPDDLRPALRGTDAARSEPALSTWLLGRFDLADAMDWDMATPQQRLFLLDRPSLARLARELSIAIHRDWLARIVDGPRVRALESCLDADALRFGVEDIPEGLFRHRAATVDFEGGASHDLAARLERDGACVLLSLLPDDPHPAHRRARLRFDSAVSHHVTPFGRERRDKALDLICTHLVPGRLPQWAWLF